MRSYIVIATVLLFFAFPSTLLPASIDAPVISDLRLDRRAGSVGAVYTLSLRISDPQGPDNIVKTVHQLREKTEKILVPINDDGLYGDAVENDGIYTGRNVVPSSAAPGTHRFRIFVRDKDGNKSNQLDYRFEVVEGIET